MNPINYTLDKIGSNKCTHIWLLAALLIVLTEVMTICYPIQPGHDLFFHLMRLNALSDAIRDGNFPFYLDYNAINTYGYFTKAFYSDLLLIPFAYIALYTGDIVAYQIMLFTMTVATGIIMFKVVNIIYKKPYVAFVSSLLYTFAYYRLLDMYRRGALGESLTFTFVPIVFLGLYHIIKGDYKKWYIIAIGYSLMVFSHIISSVLMFITMAIVMLIYWKPLLKEPKRILYLVLAGIVSLFMLAYYLYPMLEQMLSNTFYYEFAYIDLNYSRKQIFFVIWGLFSGIIYPKQIFIPGVGLILTMMVMLRLFVYGKSKEMKHMDGMLLFGIFYIFAYSIYFPWDIFPFNKLSFIQLPWRLLEFVTYFFAIAGAFYFSLLLKNKIRKLVGVVVLVTLTVVMMGSDGRDYTYATNVLQLGTKPTIHRAYNLGGLEYLPMKVPSPWYLEVRGESEVEFKNNSTKIDRIEKVKGITTVSFEIDSPETLELPLLWYKGYSARLNGKEIPTKESPNGLVEVEVEESGELQAYYGGTLVQKVSPYISIISVLLLCVYIFIYSRKRKTLCSDSLSKRK